MRVAVTIGALAGVSRAAFAFSAAPSASLRTPANTRKPIASRCSANSTSSDGGMAARIVAIAISIISANWSLEMKK